MSTVSTWVDLYSIQGADFAESVLILNPDQTPVNVALCTFSANIKTDYTTVWGPNGYANAYAQLTVTIVDAPNGNIALTMAAANTASLQPSLGVGYVYDLVMVDSFGNTSKPLRGNFYVEPGVTGVVPVYGGAPVAGGTQANTPWMPTGEEGFVDDNADPSEGNV